MLRKYVKIYVSGNLNLSILECDLIWKQCDSNWNSSQNVFICVYAYVYECAQTHIMKHICEGALRGQKTCLIPLKLGTWVNASQQTHAGTESHSWKYL